MSTATTGDPPALPAPGALDAAPAVSVVARDEWRAAPPDALDLLALTEPAPRLWLGGELRAGEHGAPIITAIRVEHGQASWLQQLPAVYARNDDSRVLLEQMLALTRAVLDDREDEIAGLPLLFGAATANDMSRDGWLDWLAGWVGIELDARWSEQTRHRRGRRGVRPQRAARHRSRLRELISLALGIEVRITEPGTGAGLWQLGDAALGHTTQLTPGEAQGAVLATTATLGQSHLIDDDERGACAARGIRQPVLCPRVRGPAARGDARPIDGARAARAAGRDGRAHLRDRSTSPSRYAVDRRGRSDRRAWTRPLETERPAARRARTRHGASAAIRGDRADWAPCESDSRGHREMR